MNSIPFYRSGVIMTAMAAFGAQLMDLVLSAPVDVLLAAASGDGSALRRLGALVFTGGVIALRSRSKVQPITMGEAKPPASAGCHGAVVLIAMVVVAMSLAGCQTLEQNPATTQLVSQYAVAKYLEAKKTDQDRYAAAVRIVKIASDLKTVAAGTEVRLDALRVAVGGALAAQPLSAADRILANGLVDVLIAELEKRFKAGGGYLQEGQLVLVNDVLGWVIAVAKTVPDPAGSGGVS